MPMASFRELMDRAEKGGYAAGYFESWDLQSLSAVADAAEAVRSPVILGFSGMYMASPRCQVRERVSMYAAMVADACRSVSVPACSIFNECPSLDLVMQAIDVGFNTVMFSDDTLSEAEQAEGIRRVVEKARAVGVAVEGEMASTPGIDGGLREMPAETGLTDPEGARAFVERTGIDALAVNIGQAHVHGRREVRLCLDVLAELREAVPVPLVLHGGSSVSPADLREAAHLGIRKVNVGSVLKRSCLAAIQRACGELGPDANPYEAIGSGFAEDVLTAGRVAVQHTVEGMMRLIGSAGKA